MTAGPAFRIRRLIVRSEKGSSPARVLKRPGEDKHRPELNVVKGQRRMRHGRESPQPTHRRVEAVSYVEKPVDGSKPIHPLGENPMGIIMYTPDGYMSAQLMRPADALSLPATGSTARTRSTRKRL